MEPNCRRQPPFLLADPMHCRRRPRAAAAPSGGPTGDRRRALGAAAALLAGPWLATTAQAEVVKGNGEPGSEARALPADIRAVHTESISVVVRQGAQAGAVVQADRNLLALLETQVDARGSEGPSLRVRWKPGVSLHSRSPVKVTVTLPQVRELSVDGSGDLSGEGLQGPELRARVRGSGDLALAGLALDDLKLQVLGSGDITAAGRCRKLEVRIMGSGDVRSDGLQAEVVAVSIMGAGDASVRADAALAVSIAGAGNVLYSGAAQVTQSIAGSGSVRKR